jgi:acyl dehydratase
MALDPTSLNFETEPLAFSYDPKTLALYALGIGAKRDELDLLYEGRGPRVFPTFAVVPAMPAVNLCLARTGGNFAMVVHGAQSVRVHELPPPEGTLSTVARLRALYDLKKFAQAVVATETRLADGRLAFETEWNIVYRGEGNFGGPRPPASEAPSIPKDRPADATVDEATLPEQALLYRLSGDLNPLHADPAFAASVGFEAGPILHGLCTYGFAARAVVRGALGGDASKLRRFDAQFRRPVWPGDTLVTELFRAENNTVLVRTLAKGRPDPVLTGAWALVDP